VVFPQGHVFSFFGRLLAPISSNILAVLSSAPIPVQGVKFINPVGVAVFVTEHGYARPRVSFWGLSACDFERVRN